MVMSIIMRSRKCVSMQRRGVFVVVERGKGVSRSGTSTRNALARASGNAAGVVAFKMAVARRTQAFPRARVYLCSSAEPQQARLNLGSGPPH